MKYSSDMSQVLAGWSYQYENKNDNFSEANNGIALATTSEEKKTNNKRGM